MSNTLVTAHSAYDATRRLVGVPATGNPFPAREVALFKLDQSDSLHALWAVGHSVWESESRAQPLIEPTMPDYERRERISKVDNDFQPVTDMLSAVQQHYSAATRLERADRLIDADGTSGVHARTVTYRARTPS